MRRPEIQLGVLLDGILGHSRWAAGGWTRLDHGRLRRFPIEVTGLEARFFPRRGGDEVGIPFLLVKGTARRTVGLGDLPCLEHAHDGLCHWLRFSGVALRILERGGLVRSLGEGIDGMIRDAQAYFYSNLWC